MTNNDMPICMAEEYWANSQLSIARHYGGITIGRDEYIIVNKDGLDIFTLSTIAERKGKGKGKERKGEERRGRERRLSRVSRATS